MVTREPLVYYACAAVLFDGRAEGAAPARREAGKPRLSGTNKAILAFVFFVRCNLKANAAKRWGIAVWGAVDRSAPPYKRSIPMADCRTA